MKNLREGEDILDQEHLLDNMPAEDVVDVDLTQSQDYDPELDNEEVKGLDTFEHAHQPISDTQDPLEGEELFEESSEKEVRMLENAYQTILRESKSSAANQYIEENDNPNYDEYVAWAEEQGEPTVSIHYFRTLVRKAGKSNKSGDFKTSKPAEVEKEAVDISDFGEEFADIEEQLSGVDQSVLDPDMTVAERYDDLYNSVYLWAAIPKTESEANEDSSAGGFKRHLFICGNPGIGKGFTVKQAIRAAMSEGIEGFTTHYVRGSVGKAQSDVMGFLYKFRKDTLIIFDDCDDFLDGKLGNIMKGVLELDDPKTNTGGRAIRKLGYRAFEDLEPQPLEESSPVKNFLTNSSLGYNPLREGLAELLAGEDVEGEMLDPEDGTGDEGGTDMLPSVITFKSRILFISNKKREQLDAAVRSRTKVTELALTPEEIVERIGQLLPAFLKNETSVSPDVLSWAKNNAFKWLKLAVLADGAPITFPGGAQLKLPSIGNAFLEFRHYIDLVEQWIRLSSLYTKKKNVDLMTTPKLPLEFIRTFLVTKVIPLLEDLNS